MSHKALVTGGAGFIGSHVVDALIEAGYAVSVVDNLHTGKRENLHPAAKFYPVDIRDAEALEQVFAEDKPEVVSHQAALADVRGSLERPDEYAEVNVVGTLRLLEACRRHGVRKVVMASTGGAIYGDLPGRAAAESTEAHPLDPYGVSKLSGEHYLYAYRHNHGLDYCALRYGNVYGPRQNPAGEAGVVAIFTGRMLRGEPAVINGDGSKRRDFVYVGDIARANLLALQAGSGIYNLGTGLGTDINRIFSELAGLTGYLLPETHGPAKPGEVQWSCLDADRARHELEWEPTTTLTEGLAKTVAYFKSKRLKD